MSRKNSLIVKKLPEIGKALPSKKLFEREKKIDLKCYFYMLRQNARRLTSSLAYKLGKGGKNPIRIAYLQGKINAHERDCLELEVDLSLKDWDIISTAWENYLKTIFLEIGITDEIQMFQVVLTELYEGAFEAAKRGYTFNHQECEKVLRLARNESWFGTGSLPNDDSPIWDAIDNYKPITQNLQWSLIKEIVKPYRYSDRAIDRKLRERQKLIADLGDAQLKLYEWQRLNNKSKSIKWDNGRLFLGTKGGYKKGKFNVNKLVLHYLTK